MPRTKTGKGAGGAGSIRKITTTKNGKTYTYWQARYTEGFDPGTGKQIQRSITGKTQKEVAQAVLVGYLRYNPADACVLPRIERKKIKPFDDAQITAFLTAIQGSRFETLFILTLFTGMREGEVMGLTWDCIDFTTGIISVEKQMQLHQDKGSKGYELVSPKNGRCRTIAAAQTVLIRLQKQRHWQARQQLLLGSDWQNPEGLVFTNEFGTHLTKPTVYREYKRIVAAIGCPEARFHDLRHSYAVAALRAGDDVKTVQGNLGHATAAFTLDVYGHVTDQMKRESADRMERFIQSISAG